MAFIMAIGSIFAAMNTMYAAVAYRGREIATLRVIGFSRPAILTSFRAGIFVAGFAGRGCRDFADASVQRNADRHVECRDIQRSGICFAHHAAGSGLCDCCSR